MEAKLLARYMRLTELLTRAGIVGEMFATMKDDIHELQNSGEWDEYPFANLLKDIHRATEDAEEVEAQLSKMLTKLRDNINGA